MKSLAKKVIFLLLISLFSPIYFQIFAENTESKPDSLKKTSSNINYLSPVKKSQELYNILKKKGFKPSFQSLSSSDDYSFPHNIIINFESPLLQNDDLENADLENLESEKQAGEKTQKNFYLDEEDNGKLKTVIFAFTQDYAAKKTDELISFLEDAKKLIEEKKINISLELVLTANDNINLRSQDNALHKSGSAYYAQLHYEEDNICAVIFLDTEEAVSAKKIQAAASKEIAPLYLLKSTINSLKETNMDYSIPVKFSFLYKNSLIAEDERLSSFMENKIPSIGVQLSCQEENKAFLENLLFNLNKVENSAWEKNYIFYRLGLNEIYISEGILIILFSLFSAITLFLLVFMTFRKSLQFRQIRRDIAKTWFIIPLVILLTALICQGTEALFSKTNLNFIILLGIKIFLSLIFTLFIFALQVKYNWGTSLEASHFLLQLSAGIALFVFTFKDITLLFSFFLFFTITFFFGSFKKKSFIILTFIFLFIPFFPYLYALAKYADKLELTKFKDLTFGGNFLLALLIYPFELCCFRMFTLLSALKNEDKSKDKIKFKKVIIAVAATSAIFIFIYSFYAIYLTRNQNKKNQNKMKINFSQMIESKDEFCKVDFFKTSFAGLEMKHLIIKTDANVLRYIVSIECQEAAPIYGSNYEYTFDGANKIYFVLPDNPEGEIEIIYRSDNKYEAKINFESYYKEKNNDKIIYHESRSIFVEKENE